MQIKNISSHCRLQRKKSGGNFLYSYTGEVRGPAVKAADLLQHKQNQPSMVPIENISMPRGFFVVHGRNQGVERGSRAVSCVIAVPAGTAASLAIDGACRREMLRSAALSKRLCTPAPSAPADHCSCLLVHLLCLAFSCSPGGIPCPAQCV